MTILALPEAKVNPDESFLSELDGDWSMLPKITGEGLTPEEFAVVTRRGALVRAAYLAEMSDAGPLELEGVERRGRMDGLRSVLRRRPEATVVEITTLDQPCCSPDEAAPCVGCASGVTEIVTPGVVIMTTPGVTEMVTPDADHPVNANEMVTTPLPAGADPSMSPEELELLAELNASNPAGAIEANLDEFPAFDRWPASTSDWYWTPNDEEDNASASSKTSCDVLPESPPEPRLTLLQLVELTARRFRSIDSGAGDLIGDRLERLAREIQATSANHPALVEARLQVLELEYA